MTPIETQAAIEAVHAIAKVKDFQKVLGLLQAWAGGRGRINTNSQTRSRAHTRSLLGKKP